MPPVWSRRGSTVRRSTRPPEHREPTSQQGQPTAAWPRGWPSRSRRPPPVRSMALAAGRRSSRRHTRLASTATPATAARPLQPRPLRHSRGVSCRARRIESPASPVPECAAIRSCRCSCVAARGRGTPRVLTTPTALLARISAQPMSDQRRGRSTASDDPVDRLRLRRRMRHLVPADRVGPSCDDSLDLRNVYVVLEEMRSTCRCPCSDQASGRPLAPRVSTWLHPSPTGGRHQALAPIQQCERT